MSYPTKYTRQYDFLTFANANPTRPLPGQKVNVDYDAVESSIGEVVDFLKLFTRSDGAIANGVVGRDQLSSDIIALIDAANGSSIAGTQVTYDNSSSGLAATTIQAAIDEVVSASGAISSVFGRTGTVVAVAGDYSASEVANDSGVTGTNVDDALDTLDAAISAIDTSALGNIGDVTITSIASGEILKWNGSAWVNNTLAEAGIAAAATLASTANGDGAALIGIEDSGGLITATTVEGALAENRAAIDAIEADYLTSSAIGVSVQAYDADLTTWAGLTPSANAQSLVTAANYAAMRALLDLEAGTDFYSISAADSVVSSAISALSSVYQPLDADLTALSALTTTAAGRSALEIADPNADRVLAWDDSAGAVAPIALADIAAEAAPATGDYVLIYGAEGDLRKVDWSDLPGAGGGGIASLVEDTTPQLGGDLDLNGHVITGLEIGTDVQAYDADIAAIAALTTTSYGRDFLTYASEAAFKAAVNLEIGTDVQAYDADTLKGDVEDQTITGGGRITTKDLGNLSGNTITPDPGDRAVQKITNNGSGTIAPGTNYGRYELEIINTTGAASPTTSGWDDVAGDSIGTSTTAKYRCSCSVSAEFSSMIIREVAS